MSAELKELREIKLTLIIIGLMIFTVANNITNVIIGKPIQGWDVYFSLCSALGSAGLFLCLMAQLYMWGKKDSRERKGSDVV